MTLASMTGFARADGASGAARWVWELKTVNGRGLDVRVRVPQGLDSVEAAARTAIAARLVRGTCHANLTVHRNGQAPVVRINEEVLGQVAAALDVLRQRVDATPPSLDGLLSIKGIVDVVEPEPDAEARAAEAEAMLTSLGLATEALTSARRREGAALHEILLGHLDTMERLTRAADELPARHPDAVRARLAEGVRALLGAAPMLDADRLHQEAVLLATKADIREELDRLKAHIRAARELIAEGHAVGRRLDFLAQELGRESNTLCAKSNDVGLTALGLELKAAVEQFREQVQNVE